MDIFITLLSWIAGFIAFGMLGMSLVFSLIARKPDRDLKIISGVSFFLMLLLLWLAGSAIISSTVFQGTQNAPLVNETHGTTSETSTAVKVDTTSKTRVAVKSDTTNVNFWIFFGFLFINFLLWLFGPSQDKSSQKGSITQRIIGSVQLKRDQNGLQPWDPNWKPKE